MQRRCDRNRKRSKRRGIYCPRHGCYLDSTSQKYPIYADRAEQLQERGLARKYALLAVATHTSVTLSGEWLEAFWCNECQATEWYHVRRLEGSRYDVSLAPVELWQQAIGVVHPTGNPSVGEFTRKSSRRTSYQGVKDFNCIY
ncbi:hypothetical protein Q2T42_19240 [Leptolyngbya boryana CZ1]|uniref:Uncharacterized protein n=1 Tax=Leptolyngbya boryana CZ1 TaxID=3060204 RepID=A0AA96WQC4_LEPBY|nr:hypothetical protein [Leptolyngbya boryana]WNZ43971.1 hypothetical protein Q2T42_19240 [Leptolyngbya boryana CZ1]